MPEPKARLAFTLALPPRELNPNVKTTVGRNGKTRAIHWTDIRNFKASYGGDCKKVAVDAKNRLVRTALVAGDPTPRFPLATPPPVRAHVTFAYKIRRKRDTDNLGAMLKALWDALQHAGVLIGDDSDVLTIMPIEVLVERDVPHGGEVRVWLE